MSPPSAGPLGYLRYLFHARRNLNICWTVLRIRRSTILSLNRSPLSTIFFFPCFLPLEFCTSLLIAHETSGCHGWIRLAQSLSGRRFVSSHAQPRRALPLITCLDLYPPCSPSSVIGIPSTSDDRKCFECFYSVLTLNLNLLLSLAPFHPRLSLPFLSFSLKSRPVAL